MMMMMEGLVDTLHYRNLFLELKIFALRSLNYCMDLQAE